MNLLQSQASEPEGRYTITLPHITNFYNKEEQTKLETSLELLSDQTTLILVFETMSLINSSKEINLDEEIKARDIENPLLASLSLLNSPPLTRTNLMDTPNQTNQEASMVPSKMLSGSVTLNYVQLIISVVAIIVSIIIFIDNKIDDGNQEIRNKIDSENQEIRNKIDDGNQEIRSLINSSIRDYNNRIDNTNNRIDQVYQAPTIDPP